MSPAEQIGEPPPVRFASTQPVFSPASVHDSSLYASHCCRSRHCHRSLSLENGGTGEEDDETVVMAWCDEQRWRPDVSDVNATAMKVREREIAENSDDAGGSDGGVGDLQDSGVSGGEARLSGDDGTTEGFRCVERHFRRVEKPALATSVTRWSMVCRRLVEAAMARRRETEAHGGGCFFFFR
nr:hypothetical protein Iba_chr05cCG10030 [Ipomoea batatas]